MAVPKIFITVFFVLFMLAVFVPYIKTSLTESSSTEIETDIFEGNSYLTILLNIPAMMFWTFGLNFWINLVILTPLRVYFAASLWYIISPAK